MRKRQIITTIIVLVLIGVGYFAYYQFVLMKVPSVRWLLSGSKTYIGGSCVCPFEKTYRKVCIYHSKGDNIEEILRQDQSADCSLLGCAWPTEYKYCD